ncbi:MAG: C45 family peptidase [Armatimonadia bacterium]
MTIRTHFRAYSRPTLLSGILLCVLSSVAMAQGLEPARYHCNGYLIVRLVGTPEEMGRQHGRFLGEQVRRVVKDVILEGEASTPEAYGKLMAGTRRMEKQLPDDIKRELRALAGEAKVKYEDLVALQLFGDVWRASQCSSFAAYGPATASGELIAGRNFDFFDHGVSEYAAVILHYIPQNGIPFITITWAGIINGWTAMNAEGVIAANNTSWGRSDSLDGLSTCFMIRKIVQHSATVAEGVETVQQTPRACGTNMLVAGERPLVRGAGVHSSTRSAGVSPAGDAVTAGEAGETPALRGVGEESPEAAIVEYDHERVAVRWAKKGYVIATNFFRKLYEDVEIPEEEAWCSRYGRLYELINAHYGKIDRTMNFIGDPGVAMGSINLHSVLLFPRDLSFRVAMGHAAAYRYPYRAFRITDQGVVSAE